MTKPNAMKFNIEKRFKTKKTVRISTYMGKMENTPFFFIFFPDPKIKCYMQINLAPLVNVPLNV